MKIAIHNRKGTFADHWIKYCQDNNIPYKAVNAYDNNIIEQIKDCDAFMWHHNHVGAKDVLFAKQLLFSLQMAGVKVFPDFNTGWHFDDKVGQKYLFEAIDAPLVPSYVFYTKEEAIDWVNKTTFPKVFKLRGGAGAANVRLARTKADAVKLINKAFSSGFPVFDKRGHLKETIRKYKEGKLTLWQFGSGIKRLFYKSDFDKYASKQIGYAYFQDFIPNNTCDIRIIVIGDRAFGIKRMCREDDFRASGSGNILYDKSDIDERCVELSFRINASVKSQSFVVDFVFDENNNPLIVELSYGYVASGYEACPGYWTPDMVWHEEKFNPQYWIIENLIKDIKECGN